VSDQTRQLSLDLALGASPVMTRETFFASPANQLALDYLEDGRAWPGGRLALVGPEGAGKSHLAHIWAAEAGAQILPAAELDDGRVAALTGHEAVVVEDADRGEVEGEALLRLMNHLHEGGGRLLLTGRQPPARWRLTPRDLTSRLGAVSVVEIGPPDDEALAAVLIKQFGDRRLRVDRALIDYLLARMGRSFADAARIVEALDRGSLERQVALNKRRAGQILGWTA
jgi:chromosomal replication initiation ATPase DnaA